MRLEFGSPLVVNLSVTLVLHLCEDMWLFTTKLGGSSKWMIVGRGKTTTLLLFLTPPFSISSPTTQESLSAFSAISAASIDRDGSLTRVLRSLPYIKSSRKMDQHEATQRRAKHRLQPRCKSLNSTWLSPDAKLNNQMSPTYLLGHKQMCSQSPPLCVSVPAWHMYLFCSCSCFC